jgi:CBS domain-containing protein
MKTELVKDWMTGEVITISPDTTLPEAHNMMADYAIRRLPVLDKNGRLLGIVTRGDVRGAEPSAATTLSIWEMNYLMGRLKVEEIMTRQPVTVAKEATIATAARLMLENHISGLPVLDEHGHLAGILTESDIFRMIVVHEWGIQINENTPAAITII